jgi:tRNA A-37 threonylcarbamoyl transferase component Bud32
MSTVTRTLQGEQLIGLRLKIARGIYYAMAILTVFLFTAGIPRSFEIGLHLLPESQAALKAAGLPLSFPAYVLVITDTVTIIFFAAISFWLVWQRGDELATLVVAAMLLFTGGLYTGPTANGNLPYWLLSILPGMAETMQAWFVFLFPDGRALPRWIWWVLIPLPVWRIGIWFVDYVPTYKAEFRTAENYSHTAQKAWDIGLFILLLVAGIVSQVYRYRKLSTPLQRQQTKWVLLGAVLTVLFVGTYVIVFNVLGYGSNSSLVVSLVARILRQIALMILPATMGIAVLRYRLWDIDFAINRTMVYGTLTALLLALFALSLWIISLVAQDFTASPFVAVVLAGIIFAAIFRPTGAALQRFVDRRFYRIYIDYRKPRAAPLPPLSPESFPHAHFTEYTNLTPAGQGGMSTVFRAIHPTLKREVAIKMMREHMQNDDTVNRYFEREVFTLRKLEHPNIIRIFDAGEIDSRPYMVMEFIDGPVLDAFLDNQGKLDKQQAARILKAIASALDYLHEHHIVHRDVKPANVMLDESAEDSPRPVLTDFGLAKVLGDISVESQSGVAGTFAYIAPEQIQAREDIDGRADIYAFGAMAFQLLTGELPFKNDNAGALLIAHMLHPAPNAYERDPDIPLETALAIQRAMAKDPAMRFESATAFVAALGM